MPRRVVAQADRGGAPPAIAGGRPDAAARTLWLFLCALALARAGLALVPNMWVWGLNLQRFLDPLAAWLPWLIATLALLPPVSRPLAPPLERAGDALVRSRRMALALALIVAAIAFAYPDRAAYTGDFMIRRGVADEAGRPDVLFPQAQPLDLLLHYRLPVALHGALGLAGSVTARLMGALDAAALALLGAAFALALALRGVAAIAAWAIVVFGGTLGMFTGYNKAVSEVAVLAAAVGAFGVLLAREGRGWIPLGVSLGLAFALHRSGLLLAPAAAVAFGLALRRDPAAWRRPATWIAVAIPLVALAAVLPHVVSRAIHADVGMLVSPEQARQRGVAGAWLGPVRIADLLDLVALLSPLALAAPLLAWRIGREGLRGREWPVLIALAAPLTLLMLLFQPPQGAFRDWDVFAATGVALSLIAAALVGETLCAATARRWVAVAAILAVAAPAWQWIAHASDPPRAIARVTAYLGEPPARSGSELATSWDWLGTSSYRLERWDVAARAWSRAAETAPSRRILDQWMRAELKQGHLSEAQAVLHRMVARDSTDAQAWIALAMVTSRIPDVADARRAVRKALALEPDNREAREIETYLEKNYP